VFSPPVSNRVPKPGRNGKPRQKIIILFILISMPGLQWITGLAAATGSTVHFQSKIFID